MKKSKILEFQKISQKIQLPAEFAQKYLKNKYKNIIILIIRFLNTLGSTITAAAIPMLLIQLNEAKLIPLTVLCFALGRISATKWLIPKLSFIAEYLALMCTSAFGFIVLSISCFIYFFNGTASFLILILPITFIVAILSTSDEAISASLLIDNESNAKWVHLDSTLQIFARLLGPGAGAGILLFFTNHKYVVFALDSLSYLIAVIVFGGMFIFSKEQNEKNQIDNNKKHNKISLKTLWLRNKETWIQLCFLSFGAGAYNAGALIYLNELKISTAQISIFMTAQNTAMVFTSLLLTSKNNLSKLSYLGPFLASLGLVLISQSLSLLPLCLGTSLMAIGMVLFLQTKRVEIAHHTSDSNLRKQSLALFATINSSMGMLAVVIYSLISNVISWKYTLFLGGAILLMAIFPSSSSSQSPIC